MIGVFFTPVVATLLGVLVRDERISMIAVAGMFVVILGAWLTSKPDMRSVAAGKKLPARAA
jgi:drug/metabolite transporter (DMT)-like permease